MSMQGLLHIRAGDLHAALAVVVRTRAGNAVKVRPLVISLDFDENRCELAIADARYAIRRHTLPAKGVWPGRVQLDGRHLRALSGKYPAGEELGLMATAGEVVLVRGKGRIALPRFDYGRPAIREQALKPDARHRGKPYVAPDPVGKRVEWGDTWLFSARVPVPQHRKSRKT
jgi:hypothetical protein